MDADKCAGKVDEGKVEDIYIQNGDTRPVISGSTFATKTRTTERFASRRHGGSRKKGEKPRSDFIVGKEKDTHGGLVRRVDRILRT